MTNEHRRSAHTALGAATVLATLLLGAGCSSDSDDGPADAGPTTTAPEQKMSSDVNVAAGLSAMQVSADAVVAAGPDTQSAVKAADGVEAAWQSIEGTVKRNEPGIYTDIEDSLSLLESAVEGDEDKGQIGVTDLASSIADYLEKYPA